MIVADDHLGESVLDIIHSERGAAFHVMTVVVAMGNARQNVVHVVGGNELLGGADEIRTGADECASPFLEVIRNIIPLVQQA